MAETKAVSNSLAAKIAAAVLDVGGRLKADKRNEQQKYNYISADKILAEAGQALAAQGVTIVPQVTGSEIAVFEYADDYGKSKRRYDVTLKLVMLITDGESEILAPWMGFGNDYAMPDKAAYKAITSGDKYFRMKLLSIGEGAEDGEHEEEPAQKPQPKPTQPAKPAQPPAERKAEPMRQAPPPEPQTEPTRDAQGWPFEMVGNLAREFELVPQRMRSTMNMSNLDPNTATMDDCRAWVMRYKAARGDDKTPQEAAKVANG